MNWYKRAKKECKGWIAVRLPKNISKKIQDWGKENIPSNILEDDGRETDTHITVMYGVCDNSVEAMKDIAKNYKSIKVKLGEISSFTKNPDFDVVKIEIISDDLKKIHGDIKRRLNVEESHDTYQPHATIAYVKKGEARQFVGNSFVKGEEIEFKKLVFINDKKEEFEIKL